MKHVTAFRVAAVLLVVFCALHTIGGMLAQQSVGPASDAVFASMKSVHFDFNGFDATWYGIWFGFGLVVSAFLLLSAVVLWQLERVRLDAWPQVAPIAWAFFAAHVFNAVMSWKYFFAGPGVFATAISMLIAFGSMRKKRAFAALLLLACAPKRIEPHAEPVAPPPAAPIATNLQPPDGGPFDFVPPKEEKSTSKSTGDLSHPGQLSGYR